MENTFESILAARVAAENTTPTPLQAAPRPPAFPVDVLPTWWHQFAKSTAEATQTPVDMVASVTLGVLSACVAGKTVIEPSAGWIEPTNLYTVAAMSPGNRKSSVFSSCIKPLRDFEIEKITEARPQVSEMAARKKLRADKAESLRKRVINGKATEQAYLDASREAEEIVVPALPRILADDATPEALQTLAYENGGKIVIASAEGGIFDIFAGRYSGAPNMEILLKGHAGDPMSIDRKGREPEVIPSVLLGFILTVQPAVLREIGKQPVEKSRGELERFLYSIPESYVGYRKINPEPIPATVSAAYYERVQSLAKALYDLQEPSVMRFSPQGQEAFRAWQEDVETMLRPDGKLGNPRLIGWGSKLAGTTARIAGILHLATGNPPSEPISADIAYSAVTISHYFSEHAIAAFHLMSFTNPHAKALALIKVIRKLGTDVFTERELLTASSRSVFSTSEDIKAALAILVENDWAFVIEPEQREGAGRPPSTRYFAHHSVFESENPAAQSAQSAESNIADTADIAEPLSNEFQESA